MKNSEIEDRIEKLISTRSFSELTKDELVFIMKEVGSEEQYIALQKIHKLLESLSPSTLEPRKNTIKSLQQKFRVQHNKVSIWEQINLVQLPGYVTVMAVLVAIVLTWVLMSSKQEIKTKTIIVASKPDTIRIVLKADTVFMNKVIYRYVPIKDESKNDFVLTSQYNFRTDSTLSASMKEKEELDDLLVTGVN